MRLQLLQSVLLAKTDVTDYLVLHSGVVLELLGPRECLISGADNLKTEGENEYLSTRHMTQQTGTLHVIKFGGVGGAKLPAIAIFDAGAEKYKGNAALRADLHLSPKYTALKTRLLARFASLAGVDAEEAVRLTQGKSVELGLEAEIDKARQRCLQRHFALHSLQHLPFAIAHASSPDEQFWEQEEKWRKQ